MTDLMLRSNNPLSALPVFRQFDRLISNPFSMTDGLLNTQTGPAVNIYETQDEFVLEAELPGWSREQVDINFENNVLTLSGHRDLQGDNRTWLRVEGLTGSFSRSFTVSSQIDASGVEAEMKDGILTVRLPKREEAKPRQIEIKTVQ
jgi:HSP20 family protein